jgi:hypothetical protein
VMRVRLSRSMISNGRASTVRICHMAKFLLGLKPLLGYNVVAIRHRGPAAAPATPTCQTPYASSAQTSTSAVPASPPHSIPHPPPPAAPPSRPTATGTPPESSRICLPPAQARKNTAGASKQVENVPTSLPLPSLVRR